MIEKDRDEQSFLLLKEVYFKVLSLVDDKYKASIKGIDAIDANLSRHGILLDIETFGYPPHINNRDKEKIYDEVVANFIADKGKGVYTQSHVVDLNVFQSAVWAVYVLAHLDSPDEQLEMIDRHSYVENNIEYWLNQSI